MIFSKSKHSMLVALTATVFLWLTAHLYWPGALGNLRSVSLPLGFDDVQMQVALALSVVAILLAAAAALSHSKNLAVAAMCVSLLLASAFTFAHAAYTFGLLPLGYARNSIADVPDTRYTPGDPVPLATWVHLSFGVFVVVFLLFLRRSILRTSKS